MSDTNQSVKEIVLYKIKPDYIESFSEKVLPEMKAFVAEQSGLLNYQSMRAMKQEGYMADIVDWDSIESAEAAAAEIKTRMEAGKMPQMTAAFDKVEFFDHFKLIS